MPNSFKKCHDSALRLLNYRPRSERELRVKLGQKFDRDIIERVIADLRSKSLIDDVAFAAFWRDSRTHFNPKSKRVLATELKLKGITGETIENMLAEVDDEDSAYRLALKKSKALALCDYDSFRRRLCAMLSRRGYSYNVIDRTVKRIYEEHKERLDIR